MEKNQKREKAQNKINLDYDWNTEYGDGDIPNADKNSVSENKTSDKKK